jgi:hypothetical protein
LYKLLYVTRRRRWILPSHPLWHYSKPVAPTLDPEF